jgi:hypothetical protein
VDNVIRQMQSITQRAWSLQSRWHIGDLAWGWYQHLEREWPTALWDNAWGWADLPGDLDQFVGLQDPQTLWITVFNDHKPLGAQRRSRPKGRGLGSLVVINKGVCGS